MNVGSLFAGIGGFDLGLERAGMRTVWFCEQDPYCQRVLARHWPGVPCYPDVRSLVADSERCGFVDTHNERRGDGETASSGRPGRRNPDDQRVSSQRHSDEQVPVQVPQVDVLCGGFPCQDLSVAGKGAGLDGERSGLWSEYARIIGELRPRYVIVENVPALLARGFGRVLGDLAALGYDAEWDCLPASAFGAPHQRDRVWVVAYPQSPGLEGQRANAGEPEVSEPWNGGPLADASRDAEARAGAQAGTERERVADQGRPLHDPLRGRHGASEGEVRPGGDGPVGAGWWSAEPNVGRVANGVPDRVDRLSALGNALVPQIAEWIGRRILEWEHA